jgi:hypothetical protein
VSANTGAAIEAEGIFIKVALKILVANAVIDAANTVFGQRPKPFNLFVCALPET